MNAAQKRELKGICNAVWALFNDPDRFKNWDTYRAREESLWERVRKIDKEAGKGLGVGRHLRWSVADGYANYIVVRVGKKETELMFLPLGDAYQFSGAYKNASGKLVVPTIVARTQINWADNLTEIFGK